MVYANEKAHGIFISTNDAYEYYDIGGPPDPAHGGWAFVADAGTTSIKGYQRCDGRSMACGEGWSHKGSNCAGRREVERRPGSAPSRAQPAVEQEPAGAPV